MPILKPRNEPYPDSVEVLLAAYPRQEGYLLQLFRVFANSERFLKKGPSNLLDKASPLTLREREIVILRTCALLGCEYEWGVHVTVFGQYAGFSDMQIQDTRGEIPGDCWTGEEHCLNRVVTDLCRSGSVSDANLPDFQDTWDLDQQLEILSLCGNYHLVSFVANTSRLEPESFAARFSERL